MDWCQSSALLVRRDAAAAGRLPRPRLLRLLRRGRLRPAAARRGLGEPVRARGAGRAPRAALQRPRRRAGTDRGTGPQPRPLHAQAPLPRRGPRGALADRAGLRRAGAAPRSPCPGTARGATGPTSAPACDPGAGEGVREAAERLNASLSALRRRAAGPRRRPRARRGRRGSRPPADGRRPAAPAPRPARGVRRSASAAATPGPAPATPTRAASPPRPEVGSSSSPETATPASSAVSWASRRHWKATLKRPRVSRYITTSIAT